MDILGYTFLGLSIAVIAFYLFVRYTDKHHPKHH